VTIENIKHFLEWNLVVLAMKFFGGQFRRRAAQPGFGLWA
jgi:hypothetical protein